MMWFQRKPTTIIFGLSILLVVASVFVYFPHKEYQDRNEAYNRQRITDILWLGHRLEEYHRVNGSYPCAPRSFSCDWQEELARLNPADPIPLDPKILEPYVYLTDGEESLIGAKIHIPWYSLVDICSKSGGGQPTWLVYQTASKDITVLCTDRLDESLRT